MGQDREQQGGGSWLEKKLAALDALFDIADRGWPCGSDNPEIGPEAAQMVVRYLSGDFLSKETPRLLDISLLWIICCVAGVVRWTEEIWPVRLVGNKMQPTCVAVGEALIGFVVGGDRVSLNIPREPGNYHERTETRQGQKGAHCLAGGQKSRGIPKEARRCAGSYRGNSTSTGGSRSTTGEVLGGCTFMRLISRAGGLSTTARSNDR